MGRVVCSCGKNEVAPKMNECCSELLLDVSPISGNAGLSFQKDGKLELGSFTTGRVKLVHPPHFRVDEVEASRDVTGPRSHSVLLANNLCVCMCVHVCVCVPVCVLGGVG